MITFKCDVECDGCHQKEKTVLEFNFIEVFDYNPRLFRGWLNMEALPDWRGMNLIKEGTDKYYSPIFCPSCYKLKHDSLPKNKSLFKRIFG